VASGGERERVREAPVSEERAVVDPEPEADHVDIGQRGADGADEAEAADAGRSTQAARQGNPGHGVRQDRRQCASVPLQRGRGPSAPGG
jgi:hypothetical protein